MPGSREREHEETDPQAGARRRRPPADEALHRGPRLVNSRTWPTDGQKGGRAKRPKAERRQARSQQAAARSAATRSERPLDGEAALAEIDRALADLAERSEEVIARLERAAETAERPPQGVLGGSLAGEPSEDLEHALTLRRENVVRGRPAAGADLPGAAIRRNVARRGSSTAIRSATLIRTSC